VANGSATDTSDLYPSQTAVSLYFTATGPQGPGQITGSATLATKTPGSGSAGGGTGTATGGSGGGGQTTANGGRGSGGTGTSTSSSKAGAAPTGVWMGGLGLAAGIMGMAIL
jgi:hypothetical protein